MTHDGRPGPDEINAMPREAFPGTGNTCADVGADFALARHEIDQSALRPGDFVSGPTQFSLAQGEVLWARASLEVAGRRNIVGTVRLWCDEREHKPTATAQGTYALPAPGTTGA